MFSPVEKIAYQDHGGHHDLFAELQKMLRKKTKLSSRTCKTVCSNSTRKRRKKKKKKKSSLWPF